MEHGLWGFRQPGEETLSDESALAISVKMHFAFDQIRPYSLIALNVEKDLQVHISSVTQPLLVWEILWKQFEFVSVSNANCSNKQKILCCTNGGRW